MSPAPSDAGERCRRHHGRHQERREAPPAATGGSPRPGPYRGGQRTTGARRRPRDRNANCVPCAKNRLVNEGDVPWPHYQGGYIPTGTVRHGNDNVARRIDDGIAGVGADVPCGIDQAHRRKVLVGVFLGVINHDRVGVNSLSRNDDHGSRCNVNAQIPSGLTAERDRNAEPGKQLLPGRGHARALHGHVPKPRAGVLRRHVERGRNGTFGINSYGSSA